ncbi:MAG: helix-turn-helix domain-containing protein [Sedimentibacter sp.]
MIGEKIRSIRKSKGLTIVELSEKINVTSGYISQIERDLISPSLAVLKRLANALEIPLSVLFLEHPQENVVKTPQDERTKIKFGNINVELEYITPVRNQNVKNLDFESFLFKLNPKSWVSEQAIIHGAKVWIYVTCGEIDCHIGDEVFKISKGDSICVPENNAHMIYNAHDEQSEALCILSPAVF